MCVCVCVCEREREREREREKERESTGGHDMLKQGHDMPKQGHARKMPKLLHRMCLKLLVYEALSLRPQATSVVYEAFSRKIPTLLHRMRLVYSSIACLQASTTPIASNSMS